MAQNCSEGEAVELMTQTAPWGNKRADDPVVLRRGGNRADDPDCSGAGGNSRLMTQNCSEGGAVELMTQTAPWGNKRADDPVVPRMGEQ